MIEKKSEVSLAHEALWKPVRGPVSSEEAVIDNSFRAGRTRALAKAVVDHWNEFGPDYEFEATISALEANLKL